MENYANILATIEANAARAAELDKKADAILNKPAFHAAATVAEQVAIHKAITPEQTAEAARIYSDAENLRKTNSILLENYRASFADYAAGIIAGIMGKYAGKQYGEKTREKIRNEAKAAGIGFYFDGYIDKTALVAYPLNENGYRGNYNLDVRLHARTLDNSTNVDFISKSNTISDFATLLITNPYHYTENPAEKIEQINAAFTELKRAYAAAEAAQNALNALLPNGKRYDVIGHLSKYETTAQF